MFGGKSLRSSNVRFKQLFHELKQQFPTISDDIIAACISNHTNSDSHKKIEIQDILKAKSIRYSPEEPMGRSSALPHPPDLANLTLETNSSNNTEHLLEFHSNHSTDSPMPKNSNDTSEIPKEAQSNDEKILEMNNNEGIPPPVVTNQTALEENCRSPKRPTSLSIKPNWSESPKWKNNIQLSEKCKDVPKLLNNLNDKPPRSPLSANRITNTKSSTSKCGKKITPSLSKLTPDQEFDVLANIPESNSVPSPKEHRKRLSLQNDFHDDLHENVLVPGTKKKETVSTPTQTTDTLLGGGVNLSLNVNCSMDVIQSPTRRTTSLQVTPQQVWLADPTSPRSYTSVNLTLRPPSSSPQPPIDITSQNSSLTYSTSSFDSQNGLQSRLQITVGPSASSVAASRTRSKNCDDDESNCSKLNVPVNSGSPADLTDKTQSLVVKQQARIERLRIELRNENSRLVIINNEVKDIQMKNNQDKKTNSETKKELKLRIAHLRCQCEQLVREIDKHTDLSEFYGNIYTGQDGPLDVGSNRRNVRNGLQYQHAAIRPPLDLEGPKWNCHMCTFLNHPQLDKCEQCEMPRILHVSAAPGDNIHIHVTPRVARRFVHSWIV